MNKKRSLDEFLVKKLENDIRDIEKEEYSFVEQSGHTIDAREYSLELKKRSLIRSLILEKHLTIEDFINSLLEMKLLEIVNNEKTNPREANEYFNKLFDDGKNFLSGNYSLSFRKKITLLRIIKVIGEKLYEDLVLLNSLRNSCGHVWALEEESIEEVKLTGVKRHKKRKCVLNFEGKNLFESKNFISFIKKYQDVFSQIVELQEELRA